MIIQFQTEQPILAKKQKGRYWISGHPFLLFFLRIINSFCWFQLFFFFFRYMQHQTAAGSRHASPAGGELCSFMHVASQEELHILRDPSDPLKVEEDGSRRVNKFLLPETPRVPRSQLICYTAVTLILGTGGLIPSIKTSLEGNLKEKRKTLWCK